MKYKKNMIILVLAILLLFIASASASDVNDASLTDEDTNQMELSADNEIIEDNLKTSDKDTQLTQSNHDETVSVENELDILSEAEGTFTDLKNEIGSGGNKKLTKAYYRYNATTDASATNIQIINKGVIDGNGAIIDMTGSTIRTFYINGVVTIKNLTIKNSNYNGDGGAIYFMNNGKVTDCNFINNTVSGNGGAVYFDFNGEVTNCNFTGNHASGDGGALYFRPTDGVVTNCKFTNNSANSGGAIFCNNGWAVTADTCIFKTPSDSTFNTRIRSPTLNVDNFTTIYNSGEKLTFDLKTNGSKPLSNGNISISVYYKDNNTWVCNYSCLNGEGWIVDLPVGSYYAIFNTEYADFKPINRTIAVLPSKYAFWTLNYTINSNNDSEIYLSNDFYFDSDYDAGFSEGIVINRKVTINGNGCIIDAGGKARIFKVTGDDVVLENINFINGFTTNDGGAVSFSENGEGCVSNCSFINNTAYCGGAIEFNRTGSVTNCNFVNNTASGNGGVIIWNAPDGTINGCNFTNNMASLRAGAIYWQGTNGTVKNCNFKENTATKYSAAAIHWAGNDGTVENCNFTNNPGPQKGGTIFWESSNGLIDNCNFINGTSSDSGGAIFWDAGASNGIINNSNFINNIGTSDGVIYWFGAYGTIDNCNFTNNTATNGGAVNWQRTYGTIKNSNFINNTADNGGAIYWEGTNGTMDNCKIMNTASNDDGAVYWRGDNGNIINSDFISNTATNGGAIKWVGTNATINNCNFTNNKATNGSAIYFDSSSLINTVSHSHFLNNRANAEALDVVLNENNITVIFTGQNNLLNAIYSNDVEVRFTNVTYWGVEGKTNTGNSPITPSRSNKEVNQNITVAIIVDGVTVLNEVHVTDGNGTIVLDVTVGDNYIISVRHYEDSYYTESVKTISNMKFYANVTSLTTHDRTVNITAKSNIPNDVVQGKLMFDLPDGIQINAIYASNGTWWAVHTFDDYGEYKINASYVGLDNVSINNGTIIIDKIKTELSANPVTATYNVNRYLVITLKDEQGNPLGGASVTVDLGGAKTYTTDSNGQVKISTKKLNAKVYTAKITFKGDVNYEKSSKNVKVTINKAANPLKVKAKTVKVKFSKLKKKAQKLKVTKVVKFTKKGQGTLTYKKVKGNKKIIINKKTGKVTIKKGLKKGTYKVKVKIKAKGNANYKASAFKKVTFKIKIK